MLTLHVCVAEQILTNFGPKFCTRSLTDAEQNFVKGSFFALNPLYLQVYALLCVINPQWIEVVGQLPDNVAKLFELLVIPSVSDWLCVPARIIEAVIEVAQMNPRGIRMESMNVEVQGLIPEAHREWATMSTISMVVTVLAPIWRPSRRVDGLIALRHSCLVESLSVSKALTKALHLSDGHLEASKPKPEDHLAVAENLDPETVDSHLMERLTAMFRHRLSLFNLRSTKPMFLAFSPGEDWSLPKPAGEEEHHAKPAEQDEFWAKQLSADNREEFDPKFFHNFVVSGHSDLALDPCEAIALALDKWCGKVERVLNSYDLHDSDAYLSKEGMFDAAYTQKLNVQKMIVASQEQDFVLAGVGLEMAARIWNEKTGQDDEDSLCDTVSTCLMRFQGLQERIVKESKLLEQRCQTLSEELVLNCLEGWEQKKLSPVNIYEVLAQQIYGIVADFRGQIEVLHRRAVSQLSAGGEASPWQLLSPAITRSACETLHGLLQAEARRITDMMSLKREEEFNHTLKQLQICLQAEKIHEALDFYYIARDCGRYAPDIIDKIDPNSREEGLTKLWSLKNQLDKACDQLIASGPASAAFGPAFVKEDSLVGIPTLFIIQAKNAKGENMKKGGEADGWEIGIVDEQGPVQYSLKDNDDGTYDVEFVPRFETGCTLSIAFRAGKKSTPAALKGSPFSLTFRRTSFWSKKSVMNIPKVFPGRMIFVSSPDVAMLFNVQKRLIYSLSPAEDETSHTHMWKCEQRTLSDDKDLLGDIKGAFLLSEKTFVAYTESLSTSYSGFASSMFLLEIQEGSNVCVKPLVANEQEPSQEVITPFVQQDWCWSSLSCKTENKVQGIPELVSQLRAPGLKWEAIGSDKPETGVEITNEALAAALQEKTKLTGDEVSKFGVSDLLADSYIKVGDTYFQATAEPVQEASVGLKWVEIGSEQPQGSEIVNEALAAELHEKVVFLQQKRALRSTSKYSRLSFFHFSSFASSTLSPDSYIKAGETFFRPIPAKESINENSNGPEINRHQSVQYSFKVSGLQRAKTKKTVVQGSSHRYEDFSLPTAIVSVEEDSSKTAPVVFLMTHWSEYSQAWRKRKSAIYCNGKLMVFGGCGRKARIITAYQPEDMDKEKAPLKYEIKQASGHIPCMRCNFFMAYNGKHVVLHGGIDVNNRPLNDVYAYDIEKHRWDRLLSLDIACPFVATYAASPHYLLSLYTRSNHLQIRAVDVQDITRQNSIQMCGRFIMQTLSKVRRAIRSISSTLYLQDSWLLRLSVHRALNGTDLTTSLQNVSEMVRHLTALAERNELDLTDMHEELNETKQLHTVMLNKAKDLQGKLRKTPAGEAPHTSIETCYRLRAKSLIHDDMALKADFAKISTGYTAAVAAIEKLKIQLENMQADLSTFQKQTTFFGVDPAMNQEEQIVSDQLIMLDCFKRAWDKYDALLSWAGAPLDDPSFEDMSFVQEMQEKLQELVKSCDSLGKSELYSTLNEYLQDSIEIHRFCEMIKMELGRPEQSWKAIRILCALSNEMLSPPTWVTVLQSNVMKNRSVPEFMQSVDSDYDAAMAGIDGRILRLSTHMRAGVNGVASKSMHSLTCFCEIINVQKKPLPVRSSARFLSKPTRQDVDPTVREIIGKIRMGKTKDFKELTEEDPELYNRAVDGNGNNLFHIAASNGQKKIVKEIMRNKDKLDLFARNHRGKNALDLAVEFNYQDVAEYLTEKMPALTEPHDQPQAHQNVRNCKLHGIRIDFTLHGIYPGGLAQPGGSAYLRSGPHANFVSYVPTKIKSTLSGRSEGDPAHVTAWFIVGDETGPWNFAYGSSFTEISLQHNVDTKPSAEGKSESLEQVPLHVNLGTEDASTKVKQAAASRGLKEDSVRYSRSELMAEFASYRRRVSDLELVASRNNEEREAAERQLRVHELIVRDPMNRPVIMDGVARGFGLPTICTPYYRDALGRIVVTDGISRNVDADKEAARLEADWRSAFRSDTKLEHGLDMEGKLDVQAATDAVIQAIESNGTIGSGPLSPATQKEFDILTKAGSGVLHNLSEEASLEVIESISRGQTPLAHALRLQAMSSWSGEIAERNASEGRTGDDTTSGTGKVTTTVIDPAADGEQKSAASDMMDTVPLSPATQKEFDTLAQAGSEALHNLSEEASLEVIESISRGQTPLARALRLQAMSSKAETSANIAALETETSPGTESAEGQAVEASAPAEEALADEQVKPTDK